MSSEYFMFNPDENRYEDDFTFDVSDISDVDYRIGQGAGAVGCFCLQKDEE